MGNSLTVRELRDESRQRVEARRADVSHLAQLAKSNEVYAQWDQLSADQKHSLEENALVTNPNTIAALRDFLPTDLAKEVSSYTDFSFYKEFVFYIGTVMAQPEPRTYRPLEAKLQDGRRIITDGTSIETLLAGELPNYRPLRNMSKAGRELIESFGSLDKDSPVFHFIDAAVYLTANGAFFQPATSSGLVVQCESMRFTETIQIREFVADYASSLESELRQWAPFATDQNSFALAHITYGPDNARTDLVVRDPKSLEEVPPALKAQIIERSNGRKAMFYFVPPSPQDNVGNAAFEHAIVLDDGSFLLVWSVDVMGHYPMQETRVTFFNITFHYDGDLTAFVQILLPPKSGKAVYDLYIPAAIFWYKERRNFPTIEATLPDGRRLFTQANLLRIRTSLDSIANQEKKYRLPDPVSLALKTIGVAHDDACYVFRGEHLILTPKGAFFQPNDRGDKVLPCTVRFATLDRPEIVREYARSFEDERKRLLSLVVSNYFGFQWEILIADAAGKLEIYRLELTSANEFTAAVPSPVQNDISNRIGMRKILFYLSSRAFKDIGVLYQLLLDDGNVLLVSKDGQSRFTINETQPMSVAFYFYYDHSHEYILLPPKSNNDEPESKSFRSRTRPVRLPLKLRPWVV